MWFGLRVVHLTLAALFLFSAKRKKTILLTRTTEEPLVSGNESVIFLNSCTTYSLCVNVCFTKENHLWIGRGGSGGVSDFWLAAQQVLYGGVWIYFLYVLVSEAK